jgi:putative ABC transport system permease protein
MGIVLSVTLITAVGTLAMSLRDKMIRETKQEYGDYHVSFNGISGNIASKIRNNFEVLSCGIISRENFAIINKTSEKEMTENIWAAPYRYLNIKGYDKNALDMLKVEVKYGRLPQSSSEIALDQWISEYMENKPEIGSKIKFTVGKRIDTESGKEIAVNTLGDVNWSAKEKFETEGEKEYTVVGFLENKGIFQSDAFIAKAVTFDDFKSLKDNKRYFLYLQMKSMNNIESKAEKIAASINISDIKSENSGKLDDPNFGTSDFNIQYNNSLLSLYGKSIYKGINSSMLLAFIFVVALIIICTIAIIYNSFNISVLERISQYGTLRCIGASADQIRKIVYKEAFFLSVIGIPIGLILGTIVMKFIFYIIGFLSLGAFYDIRMVISPIVIILSGVLGVFTVFISALGPANQAGKVSPLEAVKNSGSTKVEKIKKIKKSLFIKRIFGIEGQFANRNIRRNKVRYRITLFSMIISIVLYIVTSGIMGYAFKTGLADAGKSYTYHLYNNYALYDYELTKGIDKSVYTNIKKLNAVEKAYPLYNSDSTILLPMEKINPKYYELRKGIFVVKEGNDFRVGGNSFVSYGDEGLEELKENLKAGTTDKNVLNKENGIVLVNTAKVYGENGKSTVLDVTNYKVGDEIEISSRAKGKNGYKKVKIVGIVDKSILTDKYNDNAGMIMLTTPEVFKDITGSDTISHIFIQAKEGISHTEIIEYFKELQRSNAAYGYIDNEKAAKENKDTKTILSILLYGFIFVVVFIGCLNISNTISTNLILRIKEFAVLKAIGMTQQAIKKMILLEGLLYGLMSAIYGTIIGTIIYYLVFKLLAGVSEIAWTMPWKDIIVVTAGSVLITFIWSLLSMRKINLGIIAEDLRRDN